MSRLAGWFVFLGALLLAFSLSLAGGCGESAQPVVPALPVTTTTVSASLIQPADLVYQGAFRLPASSTNPDYGWEWGGTGLAYYSSGDPAGSGDGYPGSLYGIGHDQTKYVTEISLPVPVVSAARDLNALNTAGVLRDFTNIRSGLASLNPLFVDPSQLSRADLAVISGKLYSCWGVHFQSDDSRVPSHMRCALDLTGPQGTWWVLNSSEATLYSVNDYLFEVPEDFANSYLGGRRLATGRYRDGGWGGFGPNLFAIAPWEAGNPPPAGAVLGATTLIRYASNHPDGYQFGQNYKMNNYLHSDEWSGGAWLTKGSKSAVIFIGTKGTGTTEAWYGFANGVRYPIQDPPEFPYPPDQPAPYDDRGWWSPSFEAQMVFYSPADLAAVTQGSKGPHEVQPYAALKLDSFLYHIDQVAGLPSRLQKMRLGACAFDRSNGLLYIAEYRGDAENDRPLIHVFRVN